MNKWSEFAEKKRCLDNVLLKYVKSIHYYPLFHYSLVIREFIIIAIKDIIPF